MQKLSALTAADKLDDDGNLKKKYARKQAKKVKTDVPVDDDDSSGDEDFVSDSSPSESDDEDQAVISNLEVRL